MQDLYGIFTLKLKKVTRMPAGGDASSSQVCSMGDRLVRKVGISPHRYHTKFLDADIFRLVFSRRINIQKLKVGALI